MTETALAAPYARAAHEVARALNVSVSLGLSDDEARARGVHRARGGTGGPCLCQPQSDPAVASARQQPLPGGACLTVDAVQAAIPFVPFLAEAFRAAPLSAAEWLIVAAVAVAPALTAELVRSRQDPVVWVA